MRIFFSTGIVLKSLDYKEGKRIITVFSKDLGRISLIVHGISKKNSHAFGLTTPLSHIEFLGERKNGEIYRLKEGKTLDNHYFLRQNLASLTIAGKMAKLLYDSQLPEKPTPLLYFLFCSYLKQLHTLPECLYASFLLKFLLHEGLFSLIPKCSSCQKILEDVLFFDGQLSCTLCNPRASLHFSKEEWNIVTFLAQVKQFEALKATPIPSEFHEKIELLLRSLSY